MAEPGDEVAAGAGGPSRLRASDADRERVIGILKAAFVQDLLTKDELDLRVSQAFAARTHADLSALTSDLPAGVTDAQPRRAPRARRRSPAEAAKAATCVSIALGLLAAAVFMGPGNYPERLIGLVVLVIPLSGLLLPAFDIIRAV